MQDHDTYDKILNEILALVKEQQMFLVDFADLRAKVIRNVEDTHDVKENQSKISDDVEEIEKLLPELVTTKYCFEYHKDISTKIWKIVTPIIVGLVFLLIYQATGISL